MAEPRLRQWLTAGERAGQRYTLAPPQRRAGGTAGTDLGRGSGASIEFMDHRDYQPGDDLRHLDWNASARADRLIVKVFREEVSPVLELLVDGSRSMALAGTAKAAATTGLSALLATAARASGWTTRLWWSGASCELLQGSPTRPEVLPPDLFDATSNPATTVVETPPRWRPRSVRVLVTDLLFPGPPEPVLRVLGSGAAAAAVVQIVAEDDRRAPVPGNLRLEDCESLETVHVHVDAQVAAAYRAALNRHRALWRQAARAAGIALFTLVAETLVESWDVADLVEGELLRVAS